MPQTPDSASSSYCTGDEFLARYDQRIVADMLGDDGNPVSLTGLSTNTRLVMFLKQASGRVEASCAMGERYRPADLQALTGNAHEFLAGLVADIAYGLVMSRRGIFEQAPPHVKEAEETLARLSAGALIFPTTEAEKAGHVSNRNVTQAQRDSLGLISGNARYFGHRQAYYNGSF